MIRLAVPMLTLVAVAAMADEPARVVDYQIVNAREIPASLTGAAGNAEAGRLLFFDRKLTGCSGCHGSPGGPGAETDPDAVDAPDLKGLFRRMSEGTVRLWLVAPEVLSPGTAMPAYYTVGQRRDPADPRFGETRLSAAEIEDLIAYLLKATATR